MEAGKLNLEAAPFSPTDLVESGIKMFAGQARQKRIMLRAKLSAVCGGVS